MKQGTKSKFSVKRARRKPFQPADYQNKNPDGEKGEMAKDFEVPDINVRQNKISMTLKT